MLSGHLAGTAIVDALEKGDTSREFLWSYNVGYMQNYGAKQASLDVFRFFLLSSPDEDLNYGMKYRLLTEEDVLKASLGDEIHLNITETARRAFKGLKRMRLLTRLRLTTSLAKQVRAHYRNYPETPERFPEWCLKTKAFFKEAKTRIIGDRPAED
jgi:flavin-dependent dehydrogenase